MAVVSPRSCVMKELIHWNMHAPNRAARLCHTDCCAGGEWELDGVLELRNYPDSPVTGAGGYPDKQQW